MRVQGHGAGRVGGRDEEDLGRLDGVAVAEAQGEAEDLRRVDRVCRVQDGEVGVPGAQVGRGDERDAGRDCVVELGGGLGRGVGEGGRERYFLKLLEGG